MSKPNVEDGLVVEASELKNGDTVRFPGDYWVEVLRVMRSPDSVEIMFGVDSGETIYKNMMLEQMVMRGFRGGE